MYSGGLDYIPNFTTETTSNVYQIIGGLKGDALIGKSDWHWDVYASHGETNVDARQPEGFPNFQRIQNLFQADQYGKGFDIKNISPVTLGVTGHCTSGLPIFTPTGAVDNTPSVSQDCADYMLLRMNNITTLTQDIVEGTASGEQHGDPDEIFADRSDVCLGLIVPVHFDEIGPRPAAKMPANAMTRRVARRFREL